MAEADKTKPIEVEPDFDDVAISDDDLEKEDIEAKKAKKLSKKNRLKMLDSKQKKMRRKKQILKISGILLVVLAVLFIIPVTRYFMVNLVGIRSSLVVVIVEEETKNPVTGATVEISNQSALTDDFGRVEINNLKLGKLDVKASKNGYSTGAMRVTNGFGRTTADPLQLKIIGINLVVDVTDWLSGKALSSASVASGEASEKTDNTGRVNLVVSPTNDQEIEMIVSAEGYLQKRIKTKIGLASRIVSLTPDQKDYFVSTRNGKPDIFSSNLDGTNQQRIIEATGSEDSRTVNLYVASDNRSAILVSSREGKSVNAQTVAGIYRVYLESSKLEKIAEGTEVEMLGWFNDSFVYKMRNANLDIDDPNAIQIYNYNLKTGSNTRIVSAKYFPVANLVKDKLVYGTLTDYSVGTIKSHDLATNQTKTLATNIEYYYSAQISDDSLQILMAKNTSQIFSPQTNTLQNTTKPMGDNLQFSYSNDGKKIAWSEVRDGQGTLLIKENGDTKTSTVLRLPGLTTPIRWLNNEILIVTIQSSQETAHYAVSVSTGKYAKVADISNPSRF